MPRYSKGEKAFISQKLKQEATDCLKIYGVRKTSIDELANRVRIPKPSFYLFYPSKEELQYDIICEYRINLHNRFYSIIESSNNITSELLTKAVFITFKEASNSFLVQIVKNNELQYLFRKLPEDIVQENENQLLMLSEKLLAYIPTLDKHSFKSLLISYRLLFYTTLTKDDIGEQLYLESLWTLLNGLSLQCFDRGAANEKSTSRYIIT